MNKVEGIFVYDIDDLQAVAASHIAERQSQAGDAETLINAEVERFHQRRRAVNVAPAIVSLQRQAEEIRASELKRMHAKLGVLSEEQLAAIEALTRGLVNKFLHPPMQALKQAARENDSTRVDALCEAWSLPSVSEPTPKPADAPVEAVSPVNAVDESKSAERHRESEASAVGGK
jgi:glutamyl-tRNA reductase